MQIVKAKGKIAKLILLTLATALLSGCWDRIEMEDRAFVIAVAIDKSEEEGKYLITYQIGLPGGMAGGEGGGGDDKHWNVATTAKSITEGNRILAVKVGRVVNFHHLQVFVISPEIAAEGINQFTDFFFRDFESRLHTRVLISQEDAMEILDVEPKIHPPLAMYLADSLEINRRNSGRTLGAMDLGEIFGNLARGNDFAVPRAVAGKEEVKLGGAAVFRRDKFIGWLEEAESKYLRLIKGNFVRGSFILQNVMGQEVDILVTEAKTQVQTKIEQNKLKIAVKMVLEGDLEEVDNILYDTLREEFIESSEQALRTDIARESHRLITKAKEQFEAEIFDFGRRVKNQQPAFWKENEKNWRDIFKDADISVEVDFNIRRMGLIK